VYDLCCGQQGELLYACVACVQVTQHVALLSKWVAADLYAKELDLLQFELSMSRCSVDLWAAAEAVQAAHAAADGTRAHLLCRLLLPLVSVCVCCCLQAMYHVLTPCILVSSPGCCHSLEFLQLDELLKISSLEPEGALGFLHLARRSLRSIVTCTPACTPALKQLQLLCS
jgi:hypothetical protein